MLDWRLRVRSVCGGQIGNRHHGAAGRTHRLLSDERTVDLKRGGAVRTGHRQQRRRVGWAGGGRLVREMRETAWRRGWRGRRTLAATVVQSCEHAAAVAAVEIELAGFGIGGWRWWRFACDRRAECVGRNGNHAVAYRAHRFAARHRRVDLKHAATIRAGELQHRSFPDPHEPPPFRHHRSGAGVLVAHRVAEVSYSIVIGGEPGGQLRRCHGVGGPSPVIRNSLCLRADWGWLVF